MKPSLLYYFLFTCFLVISSFHFSLTVVTHSFSSVQPVMCHDYERSALLQFKDSFSVDESASRKPSAYPKAESWTSEGDDCCSWDGVECNEDTGHVIGLNLSSSCLYGSLNSSSSLFYLIHLQRLNLRDNHFNHSKIPSEVSNFSRLAHLDLSKSVFSGQIPLEIFNLSRLVSLDLSSNSMKLQKPGLKILVEKLPLLSELDLSQVNISSSVPHTMANISSLTILHLKNCSLHGELPPGIFQLPNLQSLRLNLNQLTGKIPSWLGNHTQLTALDLSENKLDGPIPESIFKLVKLKLIFLHRNYLSGTLSIELFHNLKNLTYLQLSYNNLSLLTNLTNVTLPNFKVLTLSSCNLTELPYFLKDQHELEFLGLDRNRIHGQIPKWMWNVSKETLLILELNFNFLSGFEQLPIVLPWTNIHSLDLSFNRLEGSLPIPSPSIVTYSVSRNSLTGEVSPLICNLTSLNDLDLSNNYLSGMLPQCLGNSSDSLLVLILRNNNFSGSIPQACNKKSKLRMIDFSQNNLQGKLPTSLAHCTMLEFLNLENNQISDDFPHWLGTLSDLTVLILRSNRFHGIIGKTETNSTFPNLHIIDLSRNNFMGKFPSEYLQNFNSMKHTDINQLVYLEADRSFHIPNFTFIKKYSYSMVMTVKGTERVYRKIQEVLTAIDLSSNKFEGEIPKVIGDLKALQLLNLSNNIFTDHIPLSLENLTELESLDLSKNQLSGEIPQQLAQLTFLGFLNVSCNNLIGVIPHGKQFDTFDNSSFYGNPGLCGNPLSKKCESTSEVLTPPSPYSEDEEESESLFHFDWKMVVMGYGSGLVVGIVIGHNFITRKHYEWLLKTFGKGQVKRRQKRSKGQRN